MKHGHRWTTKEIRDLMQMWADEVELDAIAKKMNTTQYAISKQIVRLRQEGVPLKRRTRGHKAGNQNKLWTQSDIEYVIRRRTERGTVEQIAAELGRTYSAINAVIGTLRKEDVPVKMLGKGCRRLWSSESLKAACIGRDLIPA